MENRKDKKIKWLKCEVILNACLEDQHLKTNNEKIDSTFIDIYFWS